jgi:transposase
VKEKNPPPWNPPPANIRELQAVLRRIEHLQEMLQMEQNRLDTAAPSIADSIKTTIKSLDSELKATRERIRQHIDNDPDLRQRRDLLDFIPGLEEAGMAHLLVALGEHYGFQNAKSAVAHACLAPKPSKSGKWVGQTHLSKTDAPCCARYCTCPPWPLGSTTPSSEPSANALRPTGKTARPSSASPCESSSISPSVSYNRAGRSIPNLNPHESRKNIV